MASNWSKDGVRWNDPERTRVSRRFRHHIRTKSNPKGRIHREVCFNSEACGSEDPAEFHHIDYAQSFLGVWVCFKCHRRVDHGWLKYRKIDVWDYSSVVRLKKESWKSLDSMVLPPSEVQASYAHQDPY